MLTCGLGNYPPKIILSCGLGNYSTGIMLTFGLGNYPPGIRLRNCKAPLKIATDRLIISCYSEIRNYCLHSCIKDTHLKDYWVQWCTSYNYDWDNLMKSRKPSVEITNISNLSNTNYLGCISSYFKGMLDVVTVRLPQDSVWLLYLCLLRLTVCTCTTK